MRKGQGFVFYLHGNETKMSEKYVLRGLKKYVKERWQEAEDDFVQAVEINDISVKGWYYLAMCRMKLKDGEGASLCFKKAMNAAKMQEPEDEDTIRNSLMELARIQAESVPPQYIAALGYLKKIVPMEFKDNDFRGDVYALLGKIYEALNKREYALYNYRQASRYGNRRVKSEMSQLENQGVRPDDPDDKDSPNLLKRKGDILFGQQKFEEACGQYKQAYELATVGLQKEDIRSEDAKRHELASIVASVVGDGWIYADHPSAVYAGRAALASMLHGFSAFINTTSIGEAPWLGFL